MAGIKVSVVMGILEKSAEEDKVRALKCALGSILVQTYRDFELLIEDTGSCDEIRQLIDRMALEDTRIRTVRHKEQSVYGVSSRSREGDEERELYLSLPAKLDRLINEARGEYVARMDDDDLSHRERLAEEVAYLESHPDMAFVGTGVVYLFQDGMKKRRILPDHPEAKDFAFNMPFIHPSVMFRKEALYKAGGYRVEKKILYCEDYDLLLRMYAAGMKGGNIRRALYRYSAKREGKRLRYRINEVIIRYERFRDLKMLPLYLPFVIKPLVVALIPPEPLKWLKLKTGVYR